MDKVILDTNVILSSLLGSSYPYKIIRDLILLDKIELHISREIIQEYRRVIYYPKFARVPNFIRNAESLLLAIEIAGNFFKPKQLHLELPDSDDLKFLELSVASNAHFLITGNKKHFPFRFFKNVEIISPADYWNQYWVNEI